MSEVDGEPVAGKTAAVDDDVNGRYCSHELLGRAQSKRKKRMTSKTRQDGRHLGGAGPDFVQVESGNEAAVHPKYSVLCRDVSGRQNLKEGNATCLF